MVERLILLKNADLNEEVDSGTLSKGQSFNTEDDEDSVPTDNIQPGEDDSPKTSQRDINLLSPNDKRSLLLLTSPSMDSINDPEGSISDNPVAEKMKKKKRRTTDRPDLSELRKSNTKNRPWYTKIDFTKPLIGIAVVVLLYLMWAKRDVWIPRLLTSNTRIRFTAMKNEEKLQERGGSPQTTKDSSSTSDEDDIIDDQNNNDQTYIGDNDDNSSTPYGKHTSQKLNLRVRRNKMSFSKDRTTKKRQESKYQAIDDDDEIDDNDDDDEQIDETAVDEVNENVEETIIKSSNVKESVFPSSIHSSKKHHHHRSGESRQKKSKIVPSSKTTLILRAHDDIVEQLYKLVKSRGKNRDLTSILTKHTGLNKAKINRFLHGKDYSILTLDLLISILNSFDSTILIVPK